MSHVTGGFAPNSSAFATRDVGVTSPSPLGVNHGRGGALRVGELNVCQVRAVGSRGGRETLASLIKVIPGEHLGKPLIFQRLYEAFLQVCHL